MYMLSLYLFIPQSPIKHKHTPCLPRLSHLSSHLVSSSLSPSLSLDGIGNAVTGLITEGSLSTAMLCRLGDRPSILSHRPT